MALKAVTPSNDVYCSSCSSRAGPEDSRCPKCNEEFTGTVDASLCGSCHSPVTIDSTKCSKCGAEFSPVKTPAGFSEDEFLRRMLLWQGVPGQGGGPPQSTGGENKEAASPAEQAQKPAAPTQRDAVDPNTFIWQLFEPLEKVLRTRKTRLEHVDALIVEAQKRINALESSQDPALQKERWRLKQWVNEIMNERRDLTTIEDSMAAMEKTYRNILAMQQTELHNREESIRARLETFKNEIERLEKEKVSIREKEQEIERKEEELRRIMAKISEKEGELADLERKLGEKVKEAEVRKKKLAETEQQLEKDKWLAAQRQLQSQMIAMRTEELEAGQGGGEIGDVKARLAELEEQMARISEERNALAKEGEEMKGRFTDVGKLLKVLDDLLGQLPPEIIRKFAKGEDFQLYEKILENCGV